MVRRVALLFTAVALPAACFAATVASAQSAPAAPPAEVVAGACAELTQRFNDAIAQWREYDAHRAAEETLARPECSALRLPMLRRLAARRLLEAQTMMAKNRPLDEYETTLVAADAAQILWQASATLGEARFDQRRFADAAEAFDRAIELVKSETLTPVPPAPADIQSLLDKAAQARLLAASDSSTKGKATYVQSVASAGGGVGGVFSPLVRGITPRAVPMPITFDYKAATLSPIGERAADELARALREQGVQKLRVVGHTDPRGGHAYNLKLSKERAEAVARFLQERGVAATIETEGVGDAQPMQLAPGHHLSQEDVHALNRRVEWRRE
jgi:outer membrane protein OmpA-like peptidoglycan-associated protein